MPRRPTKRDDPEEVMQRLLFEWVLYPVFISVAAIAAVGFLLTLMQLQNGRPAWVYSLPGLPAAGIYYYVKLRHLWHKEVKPGLTVNVGGQVGHQQIDGGSAAPVIKGKGHHTTIIVHNAPPQDAGRLMEKSADPALVPLPRNGAGGAISLTAMDGKAGLMDARSRLEAAGDLPLVAPQPTLVAKVPSAAWFSLLNEELEIAGADHEERVIELRRGDVVEGTIRSDGPLNVFIMTEEDYFDFGDSGSPDDCEAWLDDETSRKVQWRAPKAGNWHVVFDTFGKQNRRIVRVSLRKMASE